MLFVLGGRSTARRPHLALFLFLLVAILAQIAFAADESTSSTTTTTSTESTSSTTTTSTTTTSTTTTTSSSSSSSTSSTTSSTSSTTTTAANDYPVVTPPPTDDAPYMQKSAAPEGTLFIAVGAVLGAMGLSVLAWRALVAWSVNRSVRRAAMMMHSSENKGLIRTKKKRSRGSRSHSHGHGAQNSVSLGKISGNRNSSYRDSRASKVPTSGSGLFFSPTAGVHSNSNRASNYLPAGYYAAGSAAAGLAQNVGLSPDHVPGLGPQARGYTRTGSGPTPPATPMSPPSGMHDAPQQNNHSSSNLRQSYAANSTSSLNLASPPQGRTPSAYLEDLFENHPPHSPNAPH
ncbi:hypothetical protein P175DRAFT_0502655 [Aspergillus ochraceoroseus IBT 24754]|uniref:Mid2 domain-containing protein n=2 Tax=Aspergillus ochraceoroseus TaxID=138278 RepID=A0A2T5LS88_9EURO|nr:uncharacterized protein P175DRAFT_0502655 [Aspergillus ochraceoroseus IBT 24754]KKK18141.1 hypothetical protein AOCH_004002 [Aspergillus ochraceoroseus]PTU19144.1 hypothetical protein P175DRAFT_0502655 [Aspergillus ochraceoroseus IBT 24754]